jgi:hypothetical protein
MSNDYFQRTGNFRSLEEPECGAFETAPYVRRCESCADPLDEDHEGILCEDCKKAELEDQCSDCAFENNKMDCAICVPCLTTFLKGGGYAHQDENKAKIGFQPRTVAGVDV